MPKLNETGYIKNMENFKCLIEFCKLLGTNYSPTNVLIAISAMETIYQQGHTSLGILSDSMEDYKEKVIINTPLFHQISTLAARILSVAKSCNCKKGEIARIEKTVKLIRGIRLSKLPLPNSKKSEKVISSAHTSMANKLKYLKSLIDFVEKIPEYQPDIPELTPTGANAFRMTCVTSFDNLKIAFETVRKNRRDRNNIFDKEPTGLVYVADQVKAYIEAKFGPSSQELKDVRKLHFRKHKMK